MNLDALYQQFFGRPTDPVGQQHWQAQLTGGMKEADIGRAIQQSPEGVRYGVDSTYQNMLGRPVDPVGLQSWGPMFQAQGQGAVRQAVAASPEYMENMFGPAASPWQAAAQQGSMHMAMAPGNFWDYTNPLLNNQQNSNALLFQDNPIVNKLLADFTKSLTGDEDDAKKKAKAAGKHWDHAVDKKQSREGFSD